MKKLLLFAILLSVAAQAQVLMTEDFNALTIGNVSDNFTGATPGQGGYYFFASNGTAPSTSSNAAVTNAQIVSLESGNLALSLEGPNGNKGSRYLAKDGFPALWANRTPGNDILEVEVDINPGNGTTASRNTFGIYILNAAGDLILTGFHVRASTRELFLVGYMPAPGFPIGNYSLPLANAPGIQLPPNTFSRIGVAYNKTTGLLTIKGPGLETAGYTWFGSAAGTDPFEVGFVSYSGNSTAEPNASASVMILDNLQVRASNTDTLLSNGGNTISLVGTATESGNFETDYVMTTTDQVNYTLTNIFLSTTGSLQSTPGEVKFRMNGNWTVNWGGTTFPSGIGSQGGSNILVSQSGYYNVTLNAVTGAYTFTYLGAPPTISIIGSNIGTAWTTDLNLSSTNGRNYVLNNITLVQGQAKFRQNGGWLINWGNTAFPSGVGFQDGPNIPITAGTYDIAFNRYTGAYSFSPSLNSIDFNANFNEFFLYPNPAQNSVTIKSENYSLGAIKVSDVFGKTIFETTTSDNELILDCSDYPIGFYFIALLRENQIITKKLIVDK
jgi:hypothetical protein